MSSSPKKALVHNWVVAHADTEFSTVALAKELGVSLPTLLNYMKQNPEQFTKLGHGQYKVLDVSTDTAQFGGVDLDDAPGAAIVYPSDEANAAIAAAVAAATSPAPVAPLADAHIASMLDSLLDSAPVVPVVDTPPAPVQRPFDW